MAAARYVERNPVRARLTRSAWDYCWSSAQAHVEGCDDALVKVKPLLERVEDWKEFLRLPKDEATGRAFGSTSGRAGRWEATVSW